MMMSQPFPVASSQENFVAWNEAVDRWEAYFLANPRSGFGFHGYAYPCASDRSDIRHITRPQALEIYINLEGAATVSYSGAQIPIPPRSLIYLGPDVEVARSADEPHLFLSITFHHRYLTQHLADCELPLFVRRFLKERAPFVPEIRSLDASIRQTTLRLQHPPSGKGSRRLWYQSRALELMLQFLTLRNEVASSPRVNVRRQDRARSVMQILNASLASPPSLNELAARTGTSSCYLSRQFRMETGVTMTHFLKESRLLYALDLLRLGESNVSQTAAAVGYQSVSHFSNAFHGRFGCAPSVIPTLTPQEAAELFALNL